MNVKGFCEGHMDIINKGGVTTPLGFKSAKKRTGTYKYRSYRVF
jgi:hypothetical protein